MYLHDTDINNKATSQDIPTVSGRRAQSSAWYSVLKRDDQTTNSITQSELLSPCRGKKGEELEPEVLVASALPKTDF